MIFGDKDLFAVDASYLGESGGWHYVSFRVWARGKCFGDEDDAACLCGIWHWICQFMATTIDRSYPDADKLDGTTLFQEVYDPVYVTPGEESREYTIEEVMHHSSLFNRYHLDHLGMSSFDGYGILLFTCDDSTSRLLWRDRATGTINDAVYRTEAMNCAFAEFALWAQGYCASDQRPLDNQT